MLVNTQTSTPPAAVMPKSNKKLKLLDIDALELARQLTILESSLYQKIKPLECLTRSREQKENADNISNSIQTSNRVRFFLSFTSAPTRLRYFSLIRSLTGLQTPFSAKMKRAGELK